MKYFSYLLVMIMLVGLGSLFILKKPDGTPWLSFGNVAQQAQQKANTLFNEAKRNLDSAVQQTSTAADTSSDSDAIYKWQDANGNWVYSDKPNLQRNSQAHKLDPSKITIMAAEDTSILNELVAKKAHIDSQLKNPSALNPTDVKQLMMDAKNIQQLMDERTKRLDQAIGGN
ncbi:hypothetical protein PSECIP111854_03493 [Pseudoalteromonas sp. CIP111854]|uniref:DUF4124 domain-containing protein n=1 Tax=Pseudoalteromonas holothuriae TaxID=2963714 RepID=A0A9W4R313_9GAMM|nr:DUF4124 domain-containing protein [Pseudoalteromonas sp. CIP111854]CAH9064606.1 hypothetical protein PSECIP111854_03493 [Pseudoalteromonas sp. CIP111854]